MDDPVNLVDPWGLTARKYGGADSEAGKNYPIGGLAYDNTEGALDVHDRGGEARKRIPATSGRNGVKDPKVKDYGPIPPGYYQLDPQEISEGNIVRDVLGDWGDYRAPLHPNRATKTHGRSGFFIHGGKKPGSKGCIDVGQEDKTLFPELSKSKDKLWVKVK